MSNTPDLNKIHEELRRNREEKLTQHSNIPADYQCVIQVAKKDSEDFYQNLSVVEVQQVYYVVQYNKLKPNGRQVIDGSKRGYWKVTPVNKVTSDTIKDAISYYDKHQHYYINSYTSLVVYCLLKGVDLVEDGVISL